jgi:hypothetical protein
MVTVANEITARNDQPRREGGASRAQVQTVYIDLYGIKSSVSMGVGISDITEAE